jgi:hypothetical protein
LALFAVSSRKSVSFRGTQQPFSNVYYYQGTLPDATQAQAILSRIVVLEKPFHSTDVAFLDGKVWSAGGSPTANQMIFQGVTLGTGTQTVDTAMDRERAVLHRVKCGTDVRGRPVYLRKWFHSCGSSAGVSFAGTGILQNTGQISAANRTTLQTAFNDFLTLVVNTISYTLCSPKGVNNQGGVQCHAYLEHHQLGDAWRG